MGEFVEGGVIGFESGWVVRRGGLWLLVDGGVGWDCIGGGW